MSNVSLNFLYNEAKYKAYCKKYGKYEVEGQMNLGDIDWNSLSIKDSPIKENISSTEIEDLSY